jgi:cytochrome c-type biogenesis protein CcmH/NrfG
MANTRETRNSRRSGDGNGGNTQERARWLLNQGAQLLRERRPAEAASRLEEARQLDPTLMEVAINLGGAYVMQGRHDWAATVLEEASRAEPDNVMIWINLGAAYLGHLDASDDEGQRKAIAAFEKALSLDPEAPSVNYNLGLIYRERGEKQRAAAHFWRALEVNPADRDARVRLQQLGYDDNRPDDGKA